MSTSDAIAPFNHQAYMRLALQQAENNYVLATGYTLELPGNTHAEQCCLQKYADAQGIKEEHVGQSLPDQTVLYTTMEPCNLRASGNLPCVDRIIRTKTSGKPGIQRVYVGVKEPETFVGENRGRAKLAEHGVESIPVPGFEDEILKIATAGHQEVHE
ncbi:MAG: hypothetical protein Q9165_003292 [Trypethelium subeluteriae]